LSARSKYGTVNLFIFTCLFVYDVSSASNRIISARDHASIQLNFVDVDPVRGVMTGTYRTYAICGEIRRMGESDDSISVLSKRDGLLPP
jgi:small subunit ribosomal protein S21e